MPVIRSTSALPYDTGAINFWTSLEKAPELDPVSVSLWPQKIMMA